MVDRDWQVAIDPLVVKVVVHADNVDVIRPAPKLRTQLPRQQVERLKLSQGVVPGGLDVLRAIGTRNHVNCGLRMNNPGAGVNTANGFNRRHGSLDKDGLELVAPACGERVDISQAPTGPRPERDLV